MHFEISPRASCRRHARLLAGIAVVTVLVGAGVAGDRVVAQKLYVSLPGREGSPDWRIAVVNTARRAVTRWVDLRPASHPNGTRPTALRVSPPNASIYPVPYLVVLNEYANFASVVDTATDAVIGEFHTDFYGEELIFNAAGARLYLSDRFNGQVRAFRIDAGPSFTEIAAVPTGATDLERKNPRDLTISADGGTLYAANTLGHTIAVIDIEADRNTLVRTMPLGGLATDVKVAGRWGIVSGHETNNVLNEPETGHGLPKIVNGVAIRNNGQPLGYRPVMSDATRATTFDDLGTELNIFDTSTNTKHLRAFWDSVPRWLNHGAAHSIREILLGPDSPLLAPGERGFNFRTVRTDHQRAVARQFLGGPAIVLPTEVPITVGDSRGGFSGDGRGPIYVSLDSPHVVVAPPEVAYPEGRLQVDQLGTSNLAPLVTMAGGQRQINPDLAANNVAVIRDTHGRTSQLSLADIDALAQYLRSLQK